MKKLIVLLAVAIASTVFVGCSALNSDQNGSEAAVTTETSKVDLSSKGTITIMGTGFTKKQEIRLLFIDANGIKADIGYALNPEPKVSDEGTWTTTWSYGRYVKKKLIKEGKYTLKVTDADYNVIAETLITFVKAAK
jgi:hypothetical protein